MKLLLAIVLVWQVAPGTGTILYMGPGSGASSSSSSSSASSSEVFSLSPTTEISPSHCYIPSYPGDKSGVVGFIFNGIIMHYGSTDEYQLTDSSWTTAVSPVQRRYAAAAAVLNNGTVLVTGGYKGGYLSSSEIFSGEEWMNALPIPSAIYGHCMVQLSTGQVFLNGGYGSSSLRDTYLLESNQWIRKSDSTHTRGYHGCTELDLTVWVGGSKSSASVEIYHLESDNWSVGPDLPYTAWYPGEMVTYQDTIIYAGGTDRTDIHRLNDARDGWVKIGDMKSTRSWFPLLVITEATCFGVKQTTSEVSYTADQTVAYVGGSVMSSLLEIMNSSPELEPVECCDGTTTTTKYCGAGTPCDTVCGGTHSGCLTLSFADSNTTTTKVCSSDMGGVGWCYDDNVITDLTSNCGTEPGTTRRKRSYSWSTTPVWKISYCVYKVFVVAHLETYPQCCLHPTTKTKAGFRKHCCKKFDLCT